MGKDPARIAATILGQGEDSRDYGNHTSKGPEDGCGLLSVSCACQAVVGEYGLRREWEAIGYRGQKLRCTAELCR